jgi:hypothetical protein
MKVADRLPEAMSVFELAVDDPVHNQVAERNAARPSKESDASCSRPTRGSISRHRSESPPNLSLSDDHYEAIVVANGFGGAVAACRLAQAGVSVAVLKRGSAEYRVDARTVRPH